MVSRGSPTSQDFSAEEEEEDPLRFSSAGRSSSILEEMTTGLALSMLIFLLSDMRLMSATGRILTKFETIAVDSDYVTRASAARLAGLLSEEEDQPLSKDEGLSPAQLMAVVLIELKRSFDLQRNLEEEQTRGSSALKTSQVMGLRKNETVTGFIAQRRRRLTDQLGEDNMHVLLKAYADMLRADLNKDAPTLVLRSSTTGARDLRTRAEEMIAQAEERRQLFLLDSTARMNLEVEEVTDTLFEMGEKSKSVRNSLSESFSMQPISSDELLHILVEAVESRKYGQLDFMKSFYKDGSISQLMVQSKMRIVWMNDWYPLKDLTYAIAVDIEKRRVVVVFRGAITRQDWSKAVTYALKGVDNPIQEDFEGKPKRIGIHSGFHQYLFRTRKDTGTKKFDEIANLVDKYGQERIGEDYTLFVAGHSLGAALSTVFSFYASTDSRFTRNGPIKVFTFGSPYIGGHEFADSFRHQEEMGKLMYARFYNSNDLAAHAPFNFGVNRVSLRLVPTISNTSFRALLIFCSSQRGSAFRHVGIDIKIPPVPILCFRKWNPEITYIGNEGFWASYCRGIARNFLLKMPFPWQIPRMHTLTELQGRILEGRSRMGDKGKLLQKTVEELYMELAGMPLRQ
jgi:hypothetical protein